MSEACEFWSKPLTDTVSFDKKRRRKTAPPVTLYTQLSAYMPIDAAKLEMSDVPKSASMVAAPDVTSMA